MRDALSLQLVPDELWALVKPLIPAPKTRAALLDLCAQLPAVVVSRLLGLNISAADAWSRGDSTPRAAAMSPVLPGDVTAAR